MLELKFEPRKTDRNLTKLITLFRPFNDRSFVRSRVRAQEFKRILITVPWRLLYRKRKVLFSEAYCTSSQGVDFCFFAHCETVESFNAN